MLLMRAIPERCQPMLFRKGAAFSVPAFSIVTHRNKDFGDLVPEISLNRDFPVLGSAAYAALDLKGPAEFLQILLTALEACDKGNLLSGPAYAMLPRNHMRMPDGTAAAAALSRTGMVWSAVLEKRVEKIPYDL